MTPAAEAPPRGSGPGPQRDRLGTLCAAFGALHLAPVAFVLLSSGGPSPLMVSARVWSWGFYAHFILFTAAGLGYLLWISARDKVFHGGPLIDFLLIVTGFILLSSAGGVLVGAGAGPSWPALLPGVFLIALGLRLKTRRALLGG